METKHIVCLSAVVVAVAVAVGFVVVVPMSYYWTNRTPTARYSIPEVVKIVTAAR